MAFELSYEEMDGYLQQVCSGEKLLFVEDTNGEEVPVLVKYATAEDYQVAELEYRRALKEASDADLPTLVEMTKLIKSRGIFTDADEEKVAKIKRRIEGQKAVLAKTTRVPARRDRLKNIISNMESEIEAILMKREIGLELTQERKATEVKFLYLTYKGTFDPYTREPYWSDYESFNNEADFIFRKKLFIEYIFLIHGLKQEVIRYLARSNLWRIRYVTSTKTGESLFGRPVSQYNVDQLTLLYWSHFYQSVYEMMPDERPSDGIIEDDQALDAYMTDWQADRNRDAAASKAKSNKQYGQSSAWDHGETLVMKSNPMHQDIEYSDTLAEMAIHSGESNVDAAPIGKSKKSKNNPLAKKGKG